MNRNTTQVSYTTKMTIDRITNLPQVNVQINSSTVPLTVDIGGQGIMIDLDYAKNTGLFHPDVEYETRKARGMGGEEITVYLTDVDSFELAGRVTKQQNIGMMDLKHIRTGNTPVKTEGIVGYQYLRDYQLVLDYPNNLLELRESGTETGTELFDLEFMGHHLVRIPVMIENHLIFMVLDSGAGGLILNKQTAEELRIPYFPTEDKSRGIGGEVETWEGKIGGFMVFGEKYPATDVRIMDMGEFYQGGIIGHTLLKDAHLVIDYPQGKISLTKSS